MTSIEWCRNPDGTKGKTWNPIRARDRVTSKVGWFCVPVHEGRRHCYAVGTTTASRRGPSRWNDLRQREPLIGQKVLPQGRTGITGAEPPAPLN